MSDEGYTAHEVGPTPYTTWTCDELMRITPPPWRVKGVLPQTGVAFVYGGSGSGKTFLVIDLALTIATGDPQWFGRKVKAAPVLYVPLEGVQGIAGRVKAWHIHHDRPPCENFHLVREGMFSLGSDENVQGIAEAANRLGCKVVIIDTLARATPGMDENSSQYMGLAVQSLETLRGITGALVIVVHHTGKNSAQEMRGSSSLKAGADTQILVEVTPAGVRSWQANKVKDGAKVGSSVFNLREQDIGRDEDGDPVTSCAVVPDVQGQALQQAAELLKGMGRNQELVLGAVRAALAEDDKRAVKGVAGVPDGVKALRWSDAVDIGHAALVEGNLGGKQPKERAKDALTSLTKPDPDQKRQRLQASGTLNKFVWVPS